MELKFRKMHGLGNDFVFIRLSEDNIIDDIKLASKSICDRNFGVGADGVIVLTPSEVADVKMDIFNSDGSVAKMCGNAIRCVGRIIAEERGEAKAAVTVETLGGIKKVWIVENDKPDWQVKVDMGEPSLLASEIGVLGKGDPVIDVPFVIDGKEMNFTCVSMGNPHAITFVDAYDRDVMMKLGPIIENDSAFSDRTNVEFVKVEGDVLRVLVWERGAGPTLACGTGACAVLVAASLNNKAKRAATVELPGGKLFIEWKDDNKVYMTGSATHVFYGEIEI